MLNSGEPIEQFLQRLQLIVQNGFLDPKILNEPIAPETYELVQMLIHYVMVSIFTTKGNFTKYFDEMFTYQEYGRTKLYAKSCPTNLQELDVHIKVIFYKINLIQKEIAKCQSKYLEHKREQQEILQAFSVSKRDVNLNQLR